MSEAETRPNDLEEGDTAWCPEFGIVEIDKIYEPDEMYDWWTVRVDKGDGKEGILETTDLKRLQADVPVENWEWEDSDTNCVFVYGYDPKGRHVVTRHFEQTVTVQLGPRGAQPFMADNGSWSDGLPLANLN